GSRTCSPPGAVSSPRRSCWKGATRDRDRPPGRLPDLTMLRLSLARLTPRRMLHLPSRTVRLRLTLLYSGLFLVSGAVLLAITYILVRRSSRPDLIIPGGSRHGPAAPRALKEALANPDVARYVRHVAAHQCARALQL